MTPETDTERLLGHPFYDRDSEAAPWRGLGRCQWFALCDHDATLTVPHPALGDVPACARCAALADPDDSEVSHA